jgi:hypothetical protein
VEQAFIDRIMETLQGAGHRLASLRPHFARCFDRIRRSAGKGDAWFVDAEPEQLTIALTVAGEWRAIRQRREGAWRERLPQILDREGELAGVREIENAFVAGSDAAGEMPPRIGRYAVLAVG